MWDHLGQPAPGTDVAGCAAAQVGLVTRRQCLAAGMGDEAIGWRVASGRWERVHAGVFLTSPGRQGWEVRAGAAFLVAGGDRPGGGAAVVGASAAYLWGLLVRPPTMVEVGVPAHRRVTAPDGVHVRRLVRFDDVLDPVLYPWRTGPAPTVLDVAARGDAGSAVALLARAVQRRVVTPDAVARELALRGRHPHGPLLRELLADVEDGVRSRAEACYARDVERAHGLPAARRQVGGRSGPARAHDNVYEAYGVVVEVDGRLGHEGWDERVRDGRRDRLAAGEGRFTTRVFWTDVAVTPCRTAAEIGGVLAARGWRGRPHRCRRRGCDADSTGGSSG